MLRKPEVLTAVNPQMIQFNTYMYKSTQTAFQAASSSLRSCDSVNLKTWVQLGVGQWCVRVKAPLARLCCWAILQLWHWRVHDLGVCMAAIASAARLRPAVIIELSLCHWSKSICERLRAHGDTSECGTQIRGWFARLHRAHSCVLSLTRWRRRFPT